MLFGWNHSFNIFTVWQGAKSYWKINEALLEKRFMMKGRSFDFRIMPMYFLALNIPLVTWRQPIAFADMHDQIITFEFFRFAWMLSGCNSSPVLCLTYFCPSVPNNYILSSSLHITSDHWSFVKFMCSFAQCCLCEVNWDKILWNSTS